MAQATLHNALTCEREDPGRAIKFYLHLEETNHLSRWWLVALALGSVLGASLLIDPASLDSPGDIVGIGFIAYVAAMCVPVYACFWREGRVVDGAIGPIGLLRKTVVYSLIFLFFEIPRIMLQVLVAAVIIGLPIQLLLTIPAHFGLGIPLLPSPTEMPWVYVPTLLVGGFVGIWLIMGGTDMTQLVPPLPYVFATGFAIKENPTEPIVFGAFIAGSLALERSALEVPYEAFAAAFPVVLIIFRDGLTSRDLALADITRLGRMRASLHLSVNARGRWRRLWYRGEVLWLLQRFKLDGEREESLWGIDSSPRRENTQALMEPLARWAFYGFEAVDVGSSFSSKIIESSRGAAYEIEWVASAENTAALCRTGLCGKTNGVNPAAGQPKA